MALAHAAGLPPACGKMSFPMSGCKVNERKALARMAAAISVRDCTATGMVVVLFFMAE